MKSSMNKINKVAVLGAGAMGAYFASAFFDAPGFSTTLVAQGERAQRLLRNGLVVNGRSYRVPVHQPADGPDPVDLVIVA